MTNGQVIIAILIMGAVTLALRALPFAIFGNGKETPAFVAYLGKVLPYAVMGMLVVYCLRDLQFDTLQGWLPAMVSVIVVAVLQVWKKKTLLSIVAGTVLYMILI